VSRATELNDSNVGALVRASAARFPPEYLNFSHNFVSGQGQKKGPTGANRQGH
jgi:hypothetical protein